MTPLQHKLPAEDIERVIQALSLVCYSEIILVMKDIWGFDNRKVEEIAKWVANAIISHAQRNATR